MLYKGMFIKHNRFMDVCIKLTKPLIRLTDGSFIVRGVFWNMGFVDSYCLNMKFSHKITVQELKDNYTVTVAKPEDTCLRYNKWIKL